MADLIVRSRRMLIESSLVPASLLIRDGRIVQVAAHDPPSEADVVDAGDLVVMPALIDTHVHINDPGRSDWEGFESATKAAASGGVSVLVDMPLNSVPATTTVEALHVKRAAAEGRLWVDVGFWGGVVPGNAPRLAGLYDAGVFGFKCFLAPSGVDDFAQVTEDDLRRALPALTELGAVLLVHAELVTPAETSRGLAHRYATYLATRPPAFETTAVDLLLRLCEQFGTRVHVVHVSSRETVPILLRARERGLAVTAETCPHYLCFASEEIPDGATEFKCAPPIRDSYHREGLWQALEAGLLTSIVSDHSPAPPSLKRRDAGDFLGAWGGIASLELRLPAVWTAGRPRGVTVERVHQWLTLGPASLAGLADVKGRLAPGYDADLVIWDPDATFTVRGARLHQRHALTPYEGLALTGRVQATFVRGIQVFGVERGLRLEPSGAMLRRRAS